MRGLAIALAQLRTALLVKLAYRFEVALEAALAVLGAAVGLVPLAAALGGGRTVGGWSFDQALVVLATFTLVLGVYEALVAPAVLALVEHVRNGTFDFLLLKPADAQLLASTARFEPFRLVQVLVAAALYAAAFARMGRAPRAVDAALFVALVAASLALLWALAFGVAAVAFWVVRLDNLTYLFGSLLDFGRWPRAAFRGALRVAFTFVVPVALMTSVPAEALLGLAGVEGAATLAAVALAFAAASRALFRLAVASYTSVG